MSGIMKGTQYPLTSQGWPLMHAIAGGGQHSSALRPQWTHIVPSQTRFGPLQPPGIPPALGQGGGAKGPQHGSPTKPQDWHIPATHTCMSPQVTLAQPAMSVMLVRSGGIVVRSTPVRS